MMQWIFVGILLVILLILGYKQWNQSQEEDFEKRDN